MDFAEQREQMVRNQILSRGITEANILTALRTVPRHFFIPAEFQKRAYEDRALPIGFGQTISQPYMVATTLKTLNLTGTEKILEIGTGSGYQAALLSLLGREVYTLEIIPELAAQAKGRLSAYGNVTVYQRDGFTGLPEEAPFDAIVVAAATPETPQAWISQLKEGGRLVVPLGSGPREVLTMIQVTKNGLEQKTFGECSFVPLTGMGG